MPKKSLVESLLPFVRELTIKPTRWFGEFDGWEATCDVVMPIGEPTRAIGRGDTPDAALESLKVVILEELRDTVGHMEEAANTARLWYADFQDEVAYAALLEVEHGTEGQQRGAGEKLAENKVIGEDE